MALNDEQRQEVDDRIELFFGHFLQHTLPEVLEQTLAGHNDSCTAHGGVAKKLDRFKWAIIGAVMVGGLGGGVGLSKLLALIP